MIFHSLKLRASVIADAPKAGQFDQMSFDNLSSFEDILSDGDVPL